MAIDAKDIFEATSQSVRRLLSDQGLGFYIPPYQRPYSWSSDKVDRLIEDIMHGFITLISKEDSFTFIGTIITIHDTDCRTIQPIVRTDVPGKVLNVIDGQQRLTTLILMCVALHNQISINTEKLLKKNTQQLGIPNSDDPFGWLHGQSLQLLAALKETFVQVQSFGTANQYPRMIRAFDDQWSRDVRLAKYNSPVANLVYSYCLQVVENEKSTDFKPVIRDIRIEGEDALVGRYIQIAKVLKNISTLKIDELIEDFPGVKEISASTIFQRSLVNHEFPEIVTDYIKSNECKDSFLGLLRLVLFGSYILDRVAVTAVKGKNEDYAFSVFESLNTTGEPLTAFETFRPRVVSAEGLENYETSDSRICIDQVADYLSTFKAGQPMQDATRDLLVFFTAAETGSKPSKRLSEQRTYLKDEYKRYESDKVMRLEFVKHLKDTAQFVQHSWSVAGGIPNLHGLPIDAATDSVKLCLSFLKDLGHSITVGPLVRFYSVAVNAKQEDQKQAIEAFEEAIKAITAFSVIWRASRRGTSGIDNVYRDLLNGNNALTNMPPLSRSLKMGISEQAALPLVNVSMLKKELCARLRHKDFGAIEDKATWISEASIIPSYTNSRQVSRFILLAAYHDTIEASDSLGLVVRGKPGVAPCFTYEGWIDEKHLSLEHIAPKDKAIGWQDTLYSNKETVHQIGNLVLVPSGANSSLSNRPWKEKQVMYDALGARSKHESVQILEASGFTFSQSTEELVELSSYLPHLVALGGISDDWSLDLASARANRILDLAWENLSSWIGWDDY